MTSIPKNNLKERMLKLGYNPKCIKLVPPTLDNSNIIKPDPTQAPVKPKPQPTCKQGTASNTGFTAAQNLTDFKPPLIANIDDWSDFDDDE